MVSKQNLVLAGVGVVFILHGGGAAEPDHVPHGASSSARRYIVIARRSEGALPWEQRGPRLAAKLTALGATVERTYSRALLGVTVTMEQRVALEVANLPDVERVELDRSTRLERPSDAGIPSHLETESSSSWKFPFSPLWNLARISQAEPPLWCGWWMPSVKDAVHVYVVDSGIRGTHRAFEGRVQSDANFADDKSEAGDCAGHGTHVAGTVGGRTYGVAPGVILHSVRVLNCQGEASASEITAGIEWVLNHHEKPAVMNLSLMFNVRVQALEEAVQSAIRAGITTIVGAGNTGKPDSCEHSPAAVEDAIRVGASTLEATYGNDSRYPGSSFGDCVDLYAPGDAILSAAHSSDTSEDVKIGTSMATAHVTGAAALYLSRRPDATPAQVKQALLETATQGVIAPQSLKMTPNRLLHVPPEMPGGK